MSVLVTANQRGIDAIDYLVQLARAPTPATIPLPTSTRRARFYHRSSGTVCRCWTQTNGMQLGHGA